MLTQHGDEAKLLAGGHSLLPLMKLRLASPSVLIDVGRLKVGHQAPFEAGDESLLEILDLTGRPVAGQHDLFVALVQRIEGVKKLLLDAFLARQELDIINQQDIGPLKDPLL